MYKGVYEITVPINDEHKFYQACLMSDIDINDDYELTFNGYCWLKKANGEYYYAVFTLTTVEEKADILYDELDKMNNCCLDMYMLDVIEDEEYDNV